MEWSDSTPPCERCQNYKKPICKTCFVGLDIRNLDAVKVFSAVRNQYVTIGPVGYPIAVKIEAVVSALDLFDIQERERVFLRVTGVINGHFIKAVQRKFEKK